MHRTTSDITTDPEQSMGYFIPKGSPATLLRTENNLAVVRFEPPHVKLWTCNPQTPLRPANGSLTLALDADKIEEANP